MTKDINVGVTWKTIQDGKTRAGGNLKKSLEGVLGDGYILEVRDVPGGNLTFDNVQDFSKWFDSI